MKNPPFLKSLDIDAAIVKLSSFCFLLFALACNFSISLTQVGAYTGIVLWLIYTYRSGNWKNTRTILLLPFVFYLIAIIISIGLAVDSGVSVSQLKKIFLVLIFFWTMNMLGQLDFKGIFIWLGDKILPLRFIKQWAQKLKSNSPDQAVELLVTVLFISAFISACYGLFQAFTYGGELDSRIQIRGTMGHVFTFSVLIMMIGLMVFSRKLIGNAQGKLIYPALMVIFICLILTMARQVWLSMFIIIGTLLVFKKRIYILLPVLGSIAIYILSPEVIQDRIASIVDFNHNSNNARILMWKGGIDVIKDYPITGCGYNCLSLIREQYPQHPVMNEFYYNLHSNVIQIAVDSGLLGLATWTGIWISYFFILFKMLRKNAAVSAPRWVILGSGAAVLSFLIAGLFETNFYDSEVVMLLYFIMALPFVDSNNAKLATSNPQSHSVLDKT